MNEEKKYLIRVHHYSKDGGETPFSRRANGSYEYHEGFSEESPKELEKWGIEYDAHLSQLEQVEIVDDWKTKRQTAVENIEVVYYGATFQGDEISQGRMSRAIIALPDDETTIEWIAKNNNAVNLTRVELKAILADAGNQQSAIWNAGRPKV